MIGERWSFRGWEPCEHEGYRVRVTRIGIDASKLFEELQLPQNNVPQRDARWHSSNEVINRMSSKAKKMLDDLLAQGR